MNGIKCPMNSNVKSWRAIDPSKLITAEDLKKNKNNSQNILFVWL